MNADADYMNRYLLYADIHELLRFHFSEYNKKLENENRKSYDNYILLDYCEDVVDNLLKAMNTYVHMLDTRIPGNLMDIKMDYSLDTMNASNWPSFDNAVVIVDTYYKNQESGNEDYFVRKFQDYCRNWFFKAFGTFNLIYNFQSYLRELQEKE